MPSLFDGPKSVLNDISNVMKQSHEKRVNAPKQVVEYAQRAKPEYAKDAARIAQEKLK